MFAAGQVTYATTPPTRSEAVAGVEEPKVPYMQVPERFHEPDATMSRQQMLELLLKQKGPKCQGCDRVFDDPRYLQLDHNTPRSDGGLNHISNRVLLCGPCNNLKSNKFTLSGLRSENKKRGHMAPPP